MSDLRRSTRNRRPVNAVAPAAPNMVQEFFGTDGMVSYRKGLKPLEFIKMMLEVELHYGRVSMLDLKDMVLAPRNPEVIRRIYDLAGQLIGLRLTLTGEVSQSFWISVLKACTNLESLEIILPKYCKVPIQVDLMHLILSMKLKTLIMHGSFNCVYKLPTPEDAEATLGTVKFPGDSRSRNNFVDTLMEVNKTSIYQLELRDDLHAETKKKTAELQQLLLLGVEHYSDLLDLDAVSPQRKVVMVRGSEREPPLKAARTIRQSPPGCFLRRVEFYAVMGHVEGMTEVLRALADTCPLLCRLALIGWSPKNPIIHILRRLNLVRFKFKMSFDMDKKILDDIISGDLFPNLRSLSLEMSSFRGLDCEGVRERLQTLREVRPNVHIQYFSQAFV